MLPEIPVICLYKSPRHGRDRRVIRPFACVGVRLAFVHNGVPSATAGPLYRLNLHGEINWVPELLHSPGECPSMSQMTTSIRNLILISALSARVAYSDEVGIWVMTFPQIVEQTL